MTETEDDDCEATITASWPSSACTPNPTVVSVCEGDYESFAEALAALQTAVTAKRVTCPKDS